MLPGVVVADLGARRQPLHHFKVGILEFPGAFAYPQFKERVLTAELEVEIRGLLVGRSAFRHDAGQRESDQSRSTHEGLQQEEGLVGRGTHERAEMPGRGPHGDKGEEDNNTGSLTLIEAQRRPNQERHGQVDERKLTTEHNPAYGKERQEKETTFKHRWATPAEMEILAVEDKQRRKDERSGGVPEPPREPN